MLISEIKSLQQKFLKELEDAEKGKKVSLPFIIHQLPEVSLIGEGEIFQVFVVGGSVCRKALVQKKGEKLKILSQNGINPTFLKKYQDLPDFIERELNKEIKVVAVNFAYPLEPVFEDGRLDGILVSGSKEYTFEKLVGKKVGKEIENFVAKKQGRKITVSVANDTICLLLSGLTKYSWQELVGGIIGTGLNFAFFLDKDKAVNLESANFDKFPLSDEARQLDKESIHPGRALLEKEVSGAYLHQLFNIASKKEKLGKHIHTTKEIDDLLVSENKEIKALARKIMDRSSELASVEIGGIAHYKKYNLTFIMEGSLFWLGLGYKRHIIDVLEKTIPYKIKFAKIDNSTILGAGKLVA